MNYIVFDLEWNQSPRGKYGENKKIPFEIIEIGAVKVNDSGKIIDEYSCIIRPKVYKDIHYKIHELTSLSMSDLKKGRRFTDATSDFIKWCGEDYMFCTWGSIDITELQRNMAFYHMPLLTPPVYFFDLQKAFSIQFEDGKITRSLEYAVEHLGIPLGPDFHRASDDAYYTALVLNMLDKSIVKHYFSIDYFQNPKTSVDEINITFDTYSKFVSKEFESKTDAMLDKTVLSTVCYKCGRRTKKKIRWFSDNSKIYYCLANCPEHGYLKGKIRMKKSFNDNYFIVKTLKLTDEAGAASIRKRQLDIRNKRKAKKSNADQ